MELLMGLPGRWRGETGVLVPPLPLPLPGELESIPPLLLPPPYRDGSSSENVVKEYDHTLFRCSGAMPPPRSRIRIVTPGAEDGSSFLIGALLLLARPSVGGPEETRLGCEDGDDEDDGGLDEGDKGGVVEQGEDEAGGTSDDNGDVEDVDDSSGGEAAIVTTTGCSTFPDSTTALKAFLRSSVTMYSRCTGTKAKVVSGWPSTTIDGRTP